MKKNLLSINLLLASLTLIFILCLNMQVKSQNEKEDSKKVSNDAQEAAVDYRSFVNETAQDILNKLAEEEGRDKAILSGQIKTEENARENLDKIKDEKSNAEKNLEKRKRIERLAKVGWDISKIFGIGDEAKVRQIQTATANRAEAEQRVEDLANKEREATEQLNKETVERAKIEQDIRTNIENRNKQKADLLATVEKWQNNPTKENQADMEEQITTISCHINSLGKVLFQTTSGTGALIYYQTLRSRERGDTPRSVTNPTETTEDVCYGNYYIWSVRKSNATSDKNKDYTVKPGKQTIKIVENR